MVVLLSNCSTGIIYSNMINRLDDTIFCRIYSQMNTSWFYCTAPMLDSTMVCKQDGFRSGRNQHQHLSIPRKSCSFGFEACQPIGIPLPRPMPMSGQFARGNVLHIQSADQCPSTCPLTWSSVWILSDRKSTLSPKSIHGRIWKSLTARR